MYKLDFLFLVENANLRGGTEIQTINITHALIEANYRARVLSVVPYSGDDDVILSFDLKSYRIYKKQKKNPINDLCNSRHYYLPSIRNWRNRTLCSPIN